MSQFPLEGGGLGRPSNDPSRRVGRFDLPTPNTQVQSQRARGNTTVARPQAEAFLGALQSTANGLSAYANKVQRDSDEDKVYRRLADQEAATLIDDRRARIAAGEEDNPFLTVDGGTGEREALVREQAEQAWASAQENMGLPDQYREDFVTSYTRRGLMAYAGSASQDIARREQNDRLLWVTNASQEDYGSSTRSGLLERVSLDLGLDPTSSEAQNIVNGVRLSQAQTRIQSLQQSIAGQGTAPGMEINDGTMAELTGLLQDPTLAPLRPQVITAIGQFNAKANRDHLSSLQAGQIRTMTSTYSSAENYALAANEQLSVLRKGRADGSLTEAQFAEYEAQINQRYANEFLSEFTRRTRGVTNPSDIANIARSMLDASVPQSVAAGLNDELLAQASQADQEAAGFQTTYGILNRFVSLQADLVTGQGNPETIRQDATTLMADIMDQVQSARNAGDLNRMYGLFQTATALAQSTGTRQPSFYTTEDLRQAIQQRDPQTVHAVVDSLAREGSGSDAATAVTELLDALTSPDQGLQDLAQVSLNRFASSDPSRVQTIANSIGNRADRIGFLAAAYIDRSQYPNLPVAAVVRQAELLEQVPALNPEDLNPSFTKRFFSSKINGDGENRTNQQEFVLDTSSGIINELYQAYYAIGTAAGQSGINRHKEALANALKRVSTMGVMVSDSNPWDGDALAVFIPAQDVANKDSPVAVFSGAHPADFRTFLSGATMLAYRAGLVSNEGILQSAYQHERFLVDASVMQRLHAGQLYLSTNLGEGGKPIEQTIDLVALTDWYNETTNSNKTIQQFVETARDIGWAVGEDRDSVLQDVLTPLRVFGNSIANNAQPGTASQRVIGLSGRNVTTDLAPRRDYATERLRRFAEDIDLTPLENTAKRPLQFPGQQLDVMQDFLNP